MPRRAWRKARLAAGIGGYLREPIQPDEAYAEVCSRVEARASRFLQLAERSIFSEPTSPHLRLLRWAGWDYARLKGSVVKDGLDATLSSLREQGVRTSLDEFKGREPIRRGDLRIDPAASTFENPRLRDGGVRASSSGTSSLSSTALYSWGLLAEEAELECLLFESHGLLELPCALWLPALPSVSGIHNLLVHLGFGRPPEAWFSQLPVRRRDGLAMRYIRAAGGVRGMRVPLPETTAVTDAERVARWLASARDRAGRAVLKTFATSAIRVAEAAMQHSLDLEGCVIFAGGEPLTERRRQFLASTGASVFGRYVATETGWIGAACPRTETPGAMHLYSDRLAVISADATGNGLGPLLFTTISPHVGTILLNTDIGDAGRRRVKPCSCALGRAGLDVEISDVHGHDKVSAEGMSVSATVLDEILDDLIEAAGGAPDSYQLREEDDGNGRARLVIVLAAQVPIRDADLITSMLERLPAHGHGAQLAARLWAEAGTIEIRREHPAISSGAKLPRVVTRAH